MIYEHGGDLDKAINKYGGKKEQWIDLSTGINPNSYPHSDINIKEFRNLPSKTDILKLNEIAKISFQTNASVSSLMGAQAAINILPVLFPIGNITILEPTYNEYNKVFSDFSRNIITVRTLHELKNSQIAILCNPNNPDGRLFSNEDLIELSKNVQVLIVDESFIDQYPENSLSTKINNQTNNIIILRSFGKFFGLAGLRLGFTITGKKLDEKIKDLIGPWPISSIASIIASKALCDNVWKENTIKYLQENSRLIDSLTSKLKWEIVGGTNLFRLYKTPNASIAQDKLAKLKVWTRRFSYSPYWIRLGIPSKKELDNLEILFKCLY